MRVPQPPLGFLDLAGLEQRRTEQGGHVDVPVVAFDRRAANGLGPVDVSGIDQLDGFEQGALGGEAVGSCSVQHLPAALPGLGDAEFVGGLQQRQDIRLVLAPLFRIGGRVRVA